MKKGLFILLIILCSIGRANAQTEIDRNSINIANDVLELVSSRVGSFDTYCVYYDSKIVTIIYELEDKYYLKTFTIIYPNRPYKGLWDKYVQIGNLEIKKTNKNKKSYIINKIMKGEVPKEMYSYFTPKETAKNYLQYGSVNTFYFTSMVKSLVNLMFRLI